MTSPERDLIARGLAGTDDELGIGGEPELRAFIRDRNYNEIDELTEWLSFTFIPRFNGLGTWSLRISTQSLAARYIDEYSGIIVKCYVDDFVETIFSGSISTEWEETSEYIQMAGNCDNVLLLSTARPDPAQDTGPYTSEYYVHTSTASSVMMALVSKNIGPLAPVGWKIPQLLIDADPLLGDVITVRARFDTLLTILAELASTPLATGLGFKIIQSDTIPNTLVFSVYQPRDKHLSTRYSVELQTATDYKRVYKRPGANYFQIGGGDDFGINRTIVEGGDATNIAEQGRRLPEFVDARGTTDLSELNQKLAEKIASAVSTNSVSIIPATVPSLRYHVDIDLGDLVTAIVRGVEYPRIVQDIEFTMDPEHGYMWIPNIADPYASDDDTLVQHLQTIQNRLSNIERNWNVPADSIITSMMHPHLKLLAGDIKQTARSAAQTGWLLCDGTAISRTAYSQLFLYIGTNYGAGDGSTTFNLPDCRDRFIMGASGTHPLGTSGGSTTININIPHTHSHGLNNHTHASQPHTHIGSHSHPLNPHRHTFTHGHNILTNADVTGKRQNGTTTPFGFDEPNVSSGTEDHTHNIPQISGSTNSQTTSNTSDGTFTSGGASFDTTSPDSNAPAATYTGSPGAPSPSTTEGDSNAIVGTVTGYLQPYIVFNVEIFAGLPQ